MEIENEWEVSEDKRGYCILKREVEKAMKEMKGRKACGIDGIPMELRKGLEGETTRYHLSR